MKRLLFLTFLSINLFIFAQSNFTIGTGIRFHKYSHIVNPVYEQYSPDHPPHLVSYEWVEKHDDKIALTVGYTYSFRLQEHFFLRIGSFMYYSQLKYDHKISKLEVGDVVHPIYLTTEIVDRQDYDFGIPLHFGFKLKKMDFSLGSTMGFLLYAKYYSQSKNSWKGGYEKFWLPPSVTADRERLWIDLLFNYKLNEFYKIGVELKWPIWQHDPLALVTFSYSPHFDRDKIRKIYTKEQIDE